MRLPRALAAGSASALAAAALAVIPTTAAHADAGCGSFAPANAYVWASGVRVHTGPSTDDTAIGECGPSPIHVYCQLQGQEVVYGAYRNNWWVYADTRLGNVVNGYLSAVFIQGGNNDSPIPGLPTC